MKIEEGANASGLDSHKGPSIERSILVRLLLQYARMNRLCLLPFALDSMSLKNQFNCIKESNRPAGLRCSPLLVYFSIVRQPSAPEIPGMPFG
jgi:hypothetical protein